MPHALDCGPAADVEGDVKDREFLESASRAYVMKSLTVSFCTGLFAVTVFYGRSSFTQAELEWGLGAGSELISQYISIKWFEKVNSPTKWSTYCLLLLIKTMS